MRATGIIRRIDDLGRVVIPKEIRRAMGVRDGDPFEIFTEKDTVCFKKYCPYDAEQWDTALAAAMALCGERVALHDRDNERVCGSLLDPKDWSCVEIKEAYGSGTIGYLYADKPLDDVELCSALRVVCAIMNR